MFRLADSDSGVPVERDLDDSHVRNGYNSVRDESEFHMVRKQRGSHMGK